ncbi:MAG: polysaccharide lyase family 7 protein [Nitrososphaerota archaeon]|jgi:LysM repeat protein|nr:polysaccharide lyase family 7 protein [Nitrososphaerota archaeon]
MKIKKHVVGTIVCVLWLSLTAVCNGLPVEATYTPSDVITSDIDYDIWTLNLPTGGILSSGDLKRNSYNDWWYPGTDAFEGYVMFQTPQRGAGERAFGSQYTRCELREIIPGSGDGHNDWGTSACWGRLGYHKLVTEVKVACVNDNPRGDYANRDYTCIGQVWGHSNDQPAMFELFYMNAKPGASSFSMRDPSVKGLITCASVYIPVGKAFIVTYECVDGVLKVWVESNEANVVKTQIYVGQLANPVDKNSYYFKVGNYDQSSDAKSDRVPDPSDVHTLVGFKSIVVEHNPIRGRLTFVDGSPVANQVVDYVLKGGGVSNLRLSVVTDADGYYYIPNVPSNGGVKTASVSVLVPTISGYTSDKKGSIAVAATTSSITGVRSGSTYNIIYTPISPSTLSSQSISISPLASSLQSSKEPVPNASIDYTAESLKGLNGVYTINGKAVTVKGEYPIDQSWFGTTISIVKKGDGSTTNSAAQNLLIKARPIAPTPSKTDCTILQNNNGGITKVTSAIEYSADNGVTWNTVSGSSIHGLTSGTYYVRIKATSSTFKSNYVTVVIDGCNASSNYIVQNGDSLWLIGLKFCVTVDAIKKANGLSSDVIYPGQQLQILKTKL